MTYTVVIILFYFSFQVFIGFSAEFSYEDETSELLRQSKNNDPRPPIILIPGLISTRLIAWKKKSCRGPDINIQDLVWLNLQKLIETMTYDAHCWLDCLKLGKNGSDPDSCKVRPDEGLDAIAELSPGNLYTPPQTQIFTALIRNLAQELGYDVNNLIGAPFDWRISPIELEERDSFFTTLKYKIETAVKRHQRPAIIMSHSMGSNMFLYFCDWLRFIDKPSIGWEKWIRTYIWAFVGFSSPLLGAPGSLKSVLSGHTFGLPLSEAQARELELTLSSTHFLNPRSRSFNESLVLFRSASGDTELNFKISDIENGEMFRWIANMFGEEMMLEKYKSLINFYENDVLKPLRVRFRRPPVRHVIMVYGVDIPTEVGYVYRMPEHTVGNLGNNNVEGNNIGPSLDEIYYETPCTSSSDPIAPNNKNTNLSDDDGETIDLDKENVLLLQQNLDTKVEKNPSNDYFDESSSNYTIKSDLESGLDICLLNDYLADRCEGQLNHNQINELYVSNITKSKVKVNRSSSPPPSSTDKSLVSSINNKREKYEDTTGLNDIRPIGCKAEVIGIHQKTKKKRKIRDSSTERTGDFTVPYNSLSYAKLWLEDTAGIASDLKCYDGQNMDRYDSVTSKDGITVEFRPARPHKHIFDTWGINSIPSQLASAIQTVDPAVEIFSSVSTQNRKYEVPRFNCPISGPDYTNTNSKNPKINRSVWKGDSTFVIEVQGIDHLDIAKSPFVHALIFEKLLPKMAIDLCLNKSCEYSPFNMRNADLPENPPTQSLWSEAIRYFDKINRMFQP